MKLAGKLMGQKAVKVIETFMEKLLAIIYLTVIIGGYATVVLHGFPKARESPHIPNYHLNVSYGVFFFALYTWRLTMTTRYVVFGVLWGHFFGYNFIYVGVFPFSMVVIFSSLAPSKPPPLVFAPLQALVQSPKTPSNFMITFPTMICCTSKDASIDEKAFPDSRGANTID